MHAGEFNKAFESIKNKITPRSSGSILWQGDVEGKKYVGGRTHHGFVVQSEEDWKKWEQTGNFFSLKGNKVVIHSEDPMLTKATDECLQNLQMKKL